MQSLCSQTAACQCQPCCHCMDHPEEPFLLQKDAVPRRHAQEQADDSAACWKDALVLQQQANLLQARSRPLWLSQVRSWDFSACHELCTRAGCQRAWAGAWDVVIYIAGALQLSALHHGLPTLRPGAAEPGLLMWHAPQRRHPQSPPRLTQHPGSPVAILHRKLQCALPGEMGNCFCMPCRYTAILCPTEALIIARVP